jgi:hypothetical protein
MSRVPCKSSTLLAIFFGMVLVDILPEWSLRVDGLLSIWLGGG